LRAQAVTRGRIRNGKPDKIGRDEGNVAGSAAEIEHLHALAKARVLKKSTRDRSVQVGLVHQTPCLGVGRAEDVSLVLIRLAQGDSPIL
jgi:hypothetical protein